MFGINAILKNVSSICFQTVAVMYLSITPMKKLMCTVSIQAYSLCLLERMGLQMREITTNHWMGHTQLVTQIVEHGP